MPYYVYAIRLDRAAMEQQLPRAFKDQNWYIDWDYPLHDGCEFYYVGQSAHTPECRFDQHKHCHADAATQGDRMRMLSDPSARRVKIDYRCTCRLRKRITTGRSNRFVRKYGINLAPEHYTDLNPIRTRKQSLAMEKQLTDTLREMGHCVYFN